MKKVISIHDDRAVPLVGVVVGHEDEDRVLVLWGDAALNPADHMHEARVEYIDELMPR